MAVVVTLVGLLYASSAYAGDGKTDDEMMGAAAEAGYGVLGEDAFLSLRLKFGYVRAVPAVGCEKAQGVCETNLRVSAQAPLRLRVADRPPREDALIRRRDWDEVADFFQLARLVEYGSGAEPLHARFGELGPVSLGHGTLMHDYYNVITTDHFQPGVYGEANTVYGGAEVVANNVVAPSVLAARGYVRPVAAFDDDHALAKVAIGASIVSDIAAPTQLATEAEQPEAVVDRTYRPAVVRDQVTSLWGVDLEAPVVETDRFDLMPYADFNGHTSLGTGLHTGTFANWRPDDDLEVSGRLEYRLVGPNYLPAYVGPLYEVDRYQYTGWGMELPAPKVRAAASAENEPAHGYAASVTARRDGLFDVTAGYADHQGDGNAAAHLRAIGRPIEQVQLGLYYYKQSMDSVGQIFGLDGSLAVAEARAQVYGPLSLHGSLGRLWRVDEEGDYRTVDDWNLGAGVSHRFD